MSSNRDTFQDAEVVRSYERDESLQAPEQRILDLLRPRLGEMSMLDVGVGTGRTTAFFAPLVKRYVGVDYAPAMVEHCVERFAGLEEQVKFVEADVRDLSRFAEHSFDLVMFSYNGLDYVSHADRLVGLQELVHMLRPGGTLVFSTHNIFSLPALHHFWDGIRLHPRRTLEHLTSQLRLRRELPVSTLPETLRLPWTVVNDGAHEFRLTTHYIRPSEQVKQLEVWFSDIQAFRLRAEGARLPTVAAMDACTDAWLYFLCTLR